MTKLKAIVWTRDRCDYCAMAKKELELRDYEIEERNIWGDWHKDDLLKVVPEAKTVPQIFVSGIVEDTQIYVGDYTMFKESLNKEKG